MQIARQISIEDGIGKHCMVLSGQQLTPLIQSKYNKQVVIICEWPIVLKLTVKSSFKNIRCSLNDKAFESIRGQHQY